MKSLTVFFLFMHLSGCSTMFAVADVVGTAAVYGAKTVIKTVDAITPDVVNKKSE